MGCLNDRSRIATFFEKLAHFFRFVRKIRVITAQTSESKKLRIGNGIFDMGRVGFDEGLTLETSAFQSLYGGQFTLSTPLINHILGREQFTLHVTTAVGLMVIVLEN